MEDKPQNLKRTGITWTFSIIETELRNLNQEKKIKDFLNFSELKEAKNPEKKVITDIVSNHEWDRDESWHRVLASNFDQACCKALDEPHSKPNAKVEKLGKSILKIIDKFKIQIEMIDEQIKEKAQKAQTDLFDSVLEFFKNNPNEYFCAEVVSSRIGLMKGYDSLSYHILRELKKAGKLKQYRKGFKYPPD